VLVDVVVVVGRGEDLALVDEVNAWMPLIMEGSDIRATSELARMSAGMRSRAMTAHAPASIAIFACSGVTTSMMTPPLSICASPVFTAKVPDAVSSVR
jgi:hypothetical protein